MQESRLDIWNDFVTYENFHEKIKLSPKLQSLLDYCEYLIHTQFDKNTKKKYKSKKKNIQLSEEHRNALKQLSRDEKLFYYLTLMKIVKNAINNNHESKPEMGQGILSEDGYARSYNLKIWKHKQFRLDRRKRILYAQREDKIKMYDLQNYILRLSKNTEYYTFVLEAINNIPHIKSHTVHIGFKEKSKLNIWIKQIQTAYLVIYWRFIEDEISKSDIRKMHESYTYGALRGSENFNSELQHRKEQLSKSIAYNVPNYQEFSDLSNEEKKNDKSDINQEEQEHNPRERKKTIIEAISQVYVDQVQDIDEMIEEEEKKVEDSHENTMEYENIFERILPQFNLKDIEQTMNYGILENQTHFKVFSHLQKPTKLKMFLNLPKSVKKQEVMEVLVTPEFLLKSNNAIQQAEIKTLIKSQNSALVYQKNTAYNKLYRARDFVFLRHVFCLNDVLYMVDKSIENVNYPPFITILRGDLQIIWGVKQTEEATVLFGDINMSNQGYLSVSQDVNLTLKFIKGFEKLEELALMKPSLSFKLFNFQWDISPKKREGSSIIKQRKSSITVVQVSSQQSTYRNFKKKQAKCEEIEKVNSEDQHKIKPNEEKVTEKKINQQKLIIERNPEEQKQEKKVDLKQNSQTIEQQAQSVQVSPLLKSIDQNNMKQGQIDEKQLTTQLTVSQIEREFDENGLVKIDKSFIKNKYILKPLQEKPPVYKKAVNGHPIWKGEWVRDEKVGGIIFINQKKIEDQKGVLSFIISNMGKNLLARKSILNISLPVDIFSPQSNLELLLYSFCYAPRFLNPAAKTDNPIDRFVKVIGFGLSNSPLYLNMEKPFNPILGETFQCWIDGCPAYAEQISHHPPIAALIYMGRGFKITTQLQSKVELHINSGKGTNEGIFRIRFDDGMEVCYRTPPGEVSGLTYGDRKFNMVGKSYYWMVKELIFVEIIFDPTKKGFFSIGKQDQPSDYFQGEICFVTQQFMDKFLAGEKRLPTHKEIVKKVGRVHGIWNKILKFEEEVVLNIDTQYPVCLEYEANPLPSDSNWRDDVAYRRLNQISRAQKQKERLQVIQRKDRKFRDKYMKSLKK